MSEFTPGPWGVGYSGGLGGDVISWNCYLDETDAKELPIHKGNEAIAVINYSTNDATHKANAKLIAAAPDLYEALKSIHDALKTNSLTPEHQNEALKALNKATD